MTTLDKETWQRIKQRGDARGLAPTAVALATFAEVLGCWSEEKRFCINLTLFNRLPLHRQVNALGRRIHLQQPPGGGPDAGRELRDAGWTAVEPPVGRHGTPFLQRASASCANWAADAARRRASCP